MSEPQNRSGCGGEEQESHPCPYQEFNPGRPALSLVPTLTEMLRLLSSFETCYKFISNLLHSSVYFLFKIQFSVQNLIFVFLLGLALLKN
jgi:hypothetical protein